MTLRIVGGVLGLALLAACGAGTDDSGTEEETPSTSVPRENTTTSEAQVPEDAELIGIAIRDLSARLDIPEEDIEVVEIRTVQWPDGSLGCPEEGMMYTQALVDGLQVLLMAEGRIYDYHSGGGEDPFLCPSEQDDGGYDVVPPAPFDE